MAEKKKAGTKKIEVKSKAQSRGRVKTMDKMKTKNKSALKASARVNVAGSESVRVVNRISPPRTLTGEDRKSSRGARAGHQYTYMKAPGMLHDFQVGDRVEVYCDHEKGRERVRGWIGGIVVQVDNKMVAVQFRSNVYLTDGWMVPDRILWYSLTSEHIRPLPGKRPASKKEKVKVIPDY
jgi:hypothetical protein